MPDQETANSAEAAVRRKEYRDLSRSSKHHQRENKNFCSYLRKKQNRITQITPIREEPEDLKEEEKRTETKSNCLKMKSCWQASEQDIETYQSRTKILKSITNSKSDLQKTLKQRSSNESRIENPIDIVKTRHIPTISGSLLKPSLQYQVSLRQYGSLLESQSSDNKFHTLEMPNKPPRRKCPRFESFHWLFRPFRGKCRKSEPKIQAVVYKTYFVKWSKPPDTLTHGYGVKSFKSPHVEMSVLRRCRSAIF